MTRLHHIRVGTGSESFKMAVSKKDSDKGMYSKHHLNLKGKAHSKALDRMKAKVTHKYKERRSGKGKQQQHEEAMSGKYE